MNWSCHYNSKVTSIHFVLSSITRHYNKQHPTTNQPLLESKLLVTQQEILFIPESSFLLFRQRKESPLKNERVASNFPPTTPTTTTKYSCSTDYFHRIVVIIIIPTLSTTQVIPILLIYWSTLAAVVANNLII